jgi:hypothetical protein
MPQLSAAAADAAAAAEEEGAYRPQHASVLATPHRTACASPLLARRYAARLRARCATRPKA